MLWLFLACGGPSPAQIALDDRVDMASAWTGCLGLSDSRKAGRCALDVLQTHKAVTVERCVAIPDTRWEGECFFQVAESSTDSLDVRYGLCSKAGEFAQDCMFHLWQRDLMALEPGNPATQDGIRGRALAILEKHSTAAMSFDYFFADTYWTWFWGAWWEQRAAQMPGDKQVCVWWADPADRAECEKWAAAAAQWMIERDIPPG